MYASFGLDELTHWGQDKIDTISQTTFSTTFPWLKIFEFWLKFHWNLFLGVLLTIPASVRIMAWRRPGDKPLSEPMIDSLLTHICVIRPQWVNSKSELVQVMAWVPSRRHAISWTNDDQFLFYMASLGRSELTHWGINKIWSSQTLLNACLKYFCCNCIFTKFCS